MATTNKGSSSSGSTTQGAARRYPVVPVLVAGGVVIVVAAIVALVISGGSKKASDGGVAQTRPVSVTGSALPPFDYAAATDPGVGKTAPTLTGQNFSGRRVTITNDGHPKVVMFVAHWCPHCRAEVPRLSKYLHSTGLPKGVELYIVPTGTNASYPNYPPSQWLQREGVGSVPTLVDSNESTAFRAFGGQDYPYMVLLDKNEKVAVRHSGELPDGTYPRLFRALAAGQSISFSAPGRSSSANS